MLLLLTLGHLEIREAKASELKRGDTVYHVANPDVRGRVLASYDGEADVLFDTPVGFSGNQTRGLARDWTCSRRLLHPTSAEAWRHKKW